MKKPISHSVFAFLMLIVFVHASIGSILLSFADEFLAGEEMESAMKTEGANLQLVFTADEWSQQVTQLGAHDFLYKGELYDAVKLEKRDGKIIVHCRKDDRETRDQQRLADQVDHCTIPSKKSQKSDRLDFSPEKIYTANPVELTPSAPAVQISKQVFPPGGIPLPPALPAHCPPPKTAV